MIRNMLYALNTGLKARPTEPGAFIYADPGKFTVYIVGESAGVTAPVGEYRKVKAVTSYGSLGYHLSEILDVQQQSGMGNTRLDYGQIVIGIIHPDGTTEGTIPARKIPYYVAK